MAIDAEITDAERAVLDGYDTACLMAADHDSPRLFEECAACKHYKGEFRRRVLAFGAAERAAGREEGKVEYMNHLAVVLRGHAPKQGGEV